MAERQGGPRTPRNPAPVSGPGALSRRTDGGPAAAYVPGMPYGEGQDFYDLQTSAAMGAPKSARNTQNARGANPRSALVPLDAPSERPDEPLTAGNPMGAGPGAEILPTTQPVGAADSAALGKYLPQLRAIAAQPEAPNGFKAFVRYLSGA